jgi:hypothetical protein
LKVLLPLGAPALFVTLSVEIGTDVPLPQAQSNAPATLMLKSAAA